LNRFQRRLLHGFFFYYSRRLFGRAVCFFGFIPVFIFRLRMRSGAIEEHLLLPLVAGFLGSTFLLFLFSDALQPFGYVSFFILRGFRCGGRLSGRCFRIRIIILLLVGRLIAAAQLGLAIPALHCLGQVGSPAVGTNNFMGIFRLNGHTSVIFHSIA